MNEKIPQPAGKKVTDTIWLCPDGVYRWTYEMDMLRNPTIILTVWKVLGIAFGAAFLFTLIVDLVQGTIRSLADLWSASKVFLILIGVFFVISIISYLLLAAAYGWKYQVLFEMTDQYVTHIQMPKQFEKAEAIGWLTALGGLAAGKPYMVGLGVDSAARNTMTTQLGNVAVLKVRRRRDTIHVNQKLDRNQVYAKDADFDFVESFLRAHCTKARIR
jgi:hypothetical protein